MTLGQKLKKLRVDKGLTQKDLADQLHVTFQTISKWENDENEPDISTLRELSKLYDCSVDYLINEEEKAKPEEVTKAVEQITKTIIIHQKELHVCRSCGKDIPEDDLEVEHLTRTERHGRTSRTVSAGEAYYHKECLAEVRRNRAEAARKAREEKAKRSQKLSFGWGIAAGVVALVAFLLIFLIGCKQMHPALSIFLSILISYGVFAAVYCIISGSYIADVFVWCASRSIRFPGIIFSWSIEGFAWLIAIKILFAILGFLFGLFFLGFAIALSAALGGISFPFVLIHNINNKYDDAL